MDRENTSTFKMLAWKSGTQQPMLLLCKDAVISATAISGNSLSETQRPDTVS